VSHRDAPTEAPSSRTEKVHSTTLGRNYLSCPWPLQKRRGRLPWLTRCGPFAGSVGSPATEAHPAAPTEVPSSRTARGHSSLLQRSNIYTHVSRLKSHDDTICSVPSRKVNVKQTNMTLKFSKLVMIVIQSNMKKKIAFIHMIK